MPVSLTLKQFYKFYRTIFFHVIINKWTLIQDSFLKPGKQTASWELFIKEWLKRCIVQEGRRIRTERRTRRSLDKLSDRSWVIPRDRNEIRPLRGFPWTNIPTRVSTKVSTTRYLAAHLSDADTVWYVSEPTCHYRSPVHQPYIPTC